jgi:hypothetical protein
VVDNNPNNPARDIVDALRSGNTFSVNGQLIDKMKFVACSPRRCVTMGETLEVRPGAPVRVILNVRDPDGENKSPYSFNNPALEQIGIYQKLNKPELAHVELIKGRVTGPVPSRLSNGELNPEYFNPLAPETTHIAQQWNQSDWGYGPVKQMVYEFLADEDSYIRARGSNLPPGTPNARDMDGNPLPDNLKGQHFLRQPAVSAPCRRHPGQ